MIELLIELEKKIVGRVFYMSRVNEKTGIDQFMRKEIETLGVKYDEQGSRNVEINQALKTASKQLTGNVGQPEFLFQSGDFLVVVEDKADLDKLLKLENDDISLEKDAIVNYALNGAVHYGKHIIENTTTIKQVFAVGAVGDGIHHEIQVAYIDTESIKLLGSIDSLEVLSPDEIQEYYRVAVCDELPKEERELLEVSQIAAELHEDLRNYGSLEGEKKATVVSAILLALEEDSFDVDDLKSMNRRTDGMIIFDAVDTYLEHAEITPYAKKGELLDQFTFIRTDITLNRKRDDLGMSPLKYFAIKLRDNLYGRIKETDFDILGNFYGEFVKYGGNDGNSLGIVLTPRHITNLMVELIEVDKHDYVLDPTCGSGSFLITAMKRMLKQCETDEERESVKKNQILGVELQQKLFTIATTNMILHGDGKSNLERNDIFHVDPETMRKKGITKVLINPPYSQAKTVDLHHLAEINFIKHSLDFIEKGGKLAAIVPQSTMVGKTKKDKEKKKAILEKHTLEAVITLNPDTFYGVGTNPCIAIFTAGIPHPERKRVKFINFEDDGYVVRKHVGLVGDGREKAQKQKLLNVLHHDEEADTNFMVKSTITWEDEWLHSFYYFNDIPPTTEDFKKTMADYLAFEFDMRAHGRGYLFDGSGDSDE